MIRLSVVLFCVLGSQVALGGPVNSQDTPVYLDHVMVTVAPAIYEAIGSSAFLRERFSSVVIDTVTATDDTWTGAYVSGKHTYIEFFCSSEPDDSGSDGIGFSVERSGGVAALAAVLSHVWGDRVHTGLQSGPEMPWYYTVSADSGDAFSSWVMEYHPAFTQMVRGAAAVASRDPVVGGDAVGPLRREEMMARDFDPRLLLADLTGVDVALNEPRRSEFIEELRLYGYELTEEYGGITAVGPDVTLRVVRVSGGRGGVTAVRMRLLRPPDADEREHLFGDSCRLMLTDTEAIWMFGG